MNLSKEEIEQTIFNQYFNKDEKTKNFIRKSLIVHGDKYNYSKVNYNGALNKVCIICYHNNKPFEFLQVANEHLRGRGCYFCCKSKKLTTSEFIKRAKEKHNDKYDYSKVEYKNSNTKVCIICKKHGEFWQQASNHLRGNGCPLCAKNQKLTTKEFIKKANKIHGEGRYDYSKVNYINNRSKVCIICNNHDTMFEFWQKPQDHFNGRGCPLCGIEFKKLTLDEFKQKANEIHGVNTYDYSRVKYANIDTKIEIICHKHGIFKQSPYCHLKGEGCPKCNNVYKGEIVIRKFLTENNIKFEEQKTFKGCKYKRQLKFDFYIPKYNLCIESDGTPHFKNINWTGKMTNEEMEENLKLNQLRDQIKNNYCKNNGINLLRIKYNENINKKLTDFFKNQNL